MNHLKNKAIATKAAVLRHERKILLSALAVTSTVAVLEQFGIRQHNDFLRTEGLFDKFYSPEED